MNHMALDGEKMDLFSIVDWQLRLKSSEIRGFLVMEVGIHQAETTIRCGRNRHFDSFEIISDLGGDRKSCMLQEK